MCGLLKHCISRLQKVKSNMTEFENECHILYLSITL